MECIFHVDAKAELLFQLFRWRPAGGAPWRRGVAEEDRGECAQRGGPPWETAGSAALPVAVSSDSLPA
jgi:hypothetical protein